MVMVPFSGRFVQGIGYRCKYRRKSRFAQTRRLHRIFDKMDIDLHWGFPHSDHTVRIDVAFLWNTVGTPMEYRQLN